MKKITVSLCLAALTVALTGCLGNDDVQNVSTVSRAVLNHLSPVDGEGDVIVSRGEYTLRFDNVKNLMVVSTTSLRYNNSDHSFTTSDLSFHAGMYNLGGYAGQVFQWRGNEGNTAVAGSPTITGMTGKLTDLYYFDNVLDIPGLGTMNNSLLSRLVLDYTYDNRYRVSTFYPDMMFAGETSTTTSADADPYKSTDPRYRIVFDWENNKATMIIYQAKFSANMPTLSAIMVKDLPVEWTSAGYVISGEDIQAFSVENGQATPVPGFPFTSLRVESDEADMTGVKINYVVGGRFNGSFSGKYVWLPTT